MSIYQDMSDAMVRVEKVIWLPGAIAEGDEVTGEFREFVDDELLDALDGPLAQQCPELKRFAEAGEDAAEGDQYPEPWEVGDALRRHRLGFLFRAETPVRKDISEKGFTYSWGYTRLVWLYASTPEEMQERAIAWVQSVYPDPAPAPDQTVGRGTE